MLPAPRRRDFNSTTVRLEDNEAEFRIKLTIIINDDLIFELARLGNSVRVISPKPLVDKLTDFLHQALRQYQ